MVPLPEGPALCGGEYYSTTVYTQPHTCTHTLIKMRDRKVLTKTRTNICVWFIVNAGNQRAEVKLTLFPPLDDHRDWPQTSQASAGEYRPDPSYDRHSWTQSFPVTAHTRQPHWTVSQKRIQTLIRTAAPHFRTLSPSGVNVCYRKVKVKPIRCPSPETEESFKGVSSQHHNLVLCLKTQTEFLLKGFFSF